MKTLTRRDAACVILSTALSGTAALAQSAVEAYPTKPIRIIVPFTAGSGTDISARLLANQLTTRLKQPVTVENKPGASGIIGLDAVAKAAPDGYTLVFSGPGLSTFGVLFKKLPFDPVKDLEPVSLVLENVGGVVINGSVPASTIAEFAAYARANPGKVNYGSLGRNTTMLMGESLKKYGNFPMAEVPYPGTPPQILALQRGDIHLAFIGIDQNMHDIQSGKLKLLAVTNRQRVPNHPNVPTVAETYPGFVAPAWAGVLAPAGTPKAIIDRLSAEIRASAATPEMKEGLAKLSNISVGTTPEEFRRELLNNMKVWEEVGKFANIQPD